MKKQISARFGSSGRFSNMISLSGTFPPISGPNVTLCNLALQCYRSQLSGTVLPHGLVQTPYSVNYTVLVQRKHTVFVRTSICLSICFIVFSTAGDISRVSIGSVSTDSTSCDFVSITKNKLCYCLEYL